MNPNEEVTTAIEDSLTDAISDDPVETSVEDSGDESSAVEADASAPTDSGSDDAASSDNDGEAAADALPDPRAMDGNQDEFDRRFGLQSKNVVGKENRIPYSRVRKIIEKNEKETRAKVEKELQAKFTPQLTEATQKVQAYEAQLQQVAQFEHILENDQRSFLQMLSQHPKYKPFFDYVGQLARSANGQAKPAEGGASASAPVDDDPRPMPDAKYPDGSIGYSEEGLEKYMQWRERQIEKRLSGRYEQQLQQVAQRYEPLARNYQAEQYMAQLMPQIQQQAEEMRKWPLFVENEPEIVKLLSENPRISPERAYQLVVLPKMQSDREKIRQEVLAEVQKAKPVAATSVTSRQVRPGVAPAKPQSLEDIVRAAADKLEG